MEKYTETEMNPKESLIEYEYHIDDITLLGFKILKLPLKQSDLPTWFSNFMGKTGVFMSRSDGNPILISGMANTYNNRLIGNQLSIGDYILYDTRCEDVYATNHDGILNLLNTITGYKFELLLDAAFESDSNSSDTKVDNDSPAITTEEDDNFTYHEPFEETSKRYQEIRTLAKMFSDVVDNLVPKSREASLAQTKIEEAVMWANAGIARNITKED